MPPAPDCVGHQAARVGDRSDLSRKVRRHVDNLARCRDDRGVQPAHIVQRIGVLMRRDGFAVIRAVQGERELAGKLVPQRLQVDRCKHVACVPEQRDHLPVRTDGAARAHGVANHAADHLEERVPSNPAVTHEPVEGRRSVEQEQRSLPLRRSRIDTSRLQVLGERLAVGLGGNDHRHGTLERSFDQIIADAGDEVRVPIVELHDMVAG